MGVIVESDGKSKLTKRGKVCGRFWKHLSQGHFVSYHVSYDLLCTPWCFKLIQNHKDLLATEPVVFWFSLWAAFSWGVLYMSFASITLVFSTRHGFNSAQSGGVYAAMSIGSIIATILGLFLEMHRRKKWRESGDTRDNPERRLFFSCVGSALMPIGMFWYGWYVPTITLRLAFAWNCLWRTTGRVSLRFLGSFPLWRLGASQWAYTLSTYLCSTISRIRTADMPVVPLPHSHFVGFLSPDTFEWDIFWLI